MSDPKSLRRPGPPTNFSVVITPQTGRLHIGQAAILETPEIGSVSGTSEAPPKIAEYIAQHLDDPDTLLPPTEVQEPAKLLWDPIARLIMSPTRYREEWSRHISDMNNERHECLKRGDLFGARFAVIRAHFYALPVSWLMVPVRLVLHFLKHWPGF